MTNTRKYIAKSILIITAALVCIFCTACDPALPLNPKYSYTSFELDIGQPIPDHIGEYVDLKSMSPESAQFVVDNTEILYDGKPVKGKKFSDAGEHTLTIKYKGRQYRKYTITVTDKEPPVVTASGNFYTFKGIPLDESEFDTVFKASDNSGKVKLKIKKPEVDYDKVGEYKIKAVAKDPSGNKAKAEAKIIVQEHEYGAIGTYVFVSIEKQHLTYFVDGKPVLDCPVVTGNTYAGHNTPRGTYRIQYMARNQMLKGREDNGDEYESFVSYWMAFIGNSYGLHDATWRGSFGGNIYQGAGSHGCVNMPYSSAAELYGLVSPGTLVMIY
ncbi:MAG: L,D-transpeptidase family protein [Mogibacterium sp.]|nr:L,D-transpeptidase family protein [Mogibacterium sp.]